MLLHKYSIFRCYTMLRYDVFWVWGISIVNMYYIRTYRNFIRVHNFTSFLMRLRQLHNTQSISANWFISSIKCNTLYVTFLYLSDFVCVSYCGYILIISMSIQYYTWSPPFEFYYLLGSLWSCAIVHITIMVYSVNCFFLSEFSNWPWTFSTHFQETWYLENRNIYRGLIRAKLLMTRRFIDYFSKH